ncbi:MAG: DNA repair protein RecN [Bacilli bacterium]|nr:DNA repair protein RecN [Bacilli bacterium]
MIREIYVKNFVLINELHLSFQSGFSCFSGETGAGKSLLIDAISILCGERCSSQSIQKGADKAFVEATVEIQEDHPVLAIINDAGYELENNTFVISREFNLEGKSVARFNQRTTTLSFLKQVMAQLVDIHSQHDNQYLLNNKFHLSLLDEYVNEKKLLKEVKDNYKLYNRLQSELEQLMKEEANPEELDFLQYQLSEMDTLDIKENEIEELEQKQKDMASFDKISSHLNNAINAIESSRYDQLYSVQKELESITNTEVLKACEEITGAYYVIDEQLSNLKDYRNSLSFDEHEFDYVQSRLFEINKLLRKHGGSYNSYKNKYQEMLERIAFIENRQSFINEQAQKVQTSKETFMEKAKMMSKARKQKAVLLEKEIQNELQDLHLENVQFNINFTEKVNSNGIDQVEFLISMNAGESLKPLAKVASGGELSRLMLGLKTIFNRLAKIETIIFDEIDNGVSGSVAYAIGKKMNTIAKQSQVFAVTHLAPVAVWANQHYLVIKNQDKQQTNTNIRPLNETERVSELAMIAQGTNSEQALLAAEELYLRCKQER